MSFSCLQGHQGTEGTALKFLHSCSQNTYTRNLFKKEFTGGINGCDKLPRQKPEVEVEFTPAEPLPALTDGTETGENGVS